VPELPGGLWYAAKRRLLGPPLVTEQLSSERLSKPLALGVLSCDGLSSGVEPGRQVRLHGMVGIDGEGHPAMINPACEPLR